MRCKRCHATISEGRKSCPNCGTLIRKRRGSITLSSQSGVSVNPAAEWINDTIYKVRTAVRRDSRILVLIAAVPLFLIGILLLVSCGANSCACSCSCGDSDARTGFEVRDNSREPSLQVAEGDMLYYISDGSIMSRSGDDTYSCLFDSLSASDLQSDGEYLYFREGNSVSCIALGQGYVSSSDAENVLDFTSDEGYELGYFIAEDKLYYYLKEKGSQLVTLYSDGPVFSGAADNFGYMNGRLYYTVSGTDAKYDLYSMNIDGTDRKSAVSGLLDYQLGGGYIYGATMSDSGKQQLVRYDAAGRELVRWNVSEITGCELSSIAANDEWLCLAVLSDSGSVVYRIEHDTTDLASVFRYSGSIKLTGVSGDWYAFESTAGEEAVTDYSVRNSRSGKSAM